MTTTQIQHKKGEMHEMHENRAVLDVSKELDRLVAEEEAKDRVLRAVIMIPNEVEEKKKERLSTIHNKEMFLIYYGQLFHIEAVCKKLGIESSTYRRWMEKDDHFRAKFFEVKGNMGEMVENKLIGLIQGGDGPSIRFWLEKKHPDYTPRSELTITPGGVDDFTAMLWREARRRWEAKNGVKVHDIVEGEVVEPKQIENGNGDQQ